MQADLFMTFLCVLCALCGQNCLRKQPDPAGLRLLGFPESLMAPQPLIAPAFLQAEFRETPKGGTKIVGDV
jgi:hypothetical protein